MKKLITYIAIALLLLVPASADALSGDPLTVDFDPNPLFSEGGNFLPGDTASGTITAENNTETEQDLYIRFIENDQANNLGDAIQISVSDSGGGEVENQSLNDWFADNKVFLTTFSGSEEVEFDVFALFEEESGNEYQNGHVDFDVCVGFSGGGEVCMDDDDDTTTTTISEHRGQFYSASDEKGDEEDVRENGEGDGEGDDPSPGGPGESPFVFGPPAGAGGGASTPPGGGAGDLALIGTGDASGEGEEGEEEPDEEGTQQAAAAFLGLPEGVADFLEGASLLLLILIIIALLTIGYDAWRDAPSLPDRERIQNRIIFVDVLLVLALILAIIIPLSRVIIPLIITTILGIIWFVAEDYRLKHGRRF